MSDTNSPMPLDIDKFLGSTMMMTTRMKLVYLWCSVCYWKNPNMNKKDLLWVIDDAWGSPFPPSKLDAMVAKFFEEIAGAEYPQESRRNTAGNPHEVAPTIQEGADNVL